MGKLIPWMGLIGLMTVLLSISFCAPWLLDDRNDFLKQFVGSDFLATLGFILTVTLASSANLHLELNKIEAETGAEFKKTRKSVAASAYSLMVIFCLAIVIVVIKPLLPKFPPNRAVINSLALVCIYFNISVLLDLTKAVFKIPAIKKIN